MCLRFSGITKKFIKIFKESFFDLFSLIRFGFYQDQIDKHKKSIDFSNLDAPASDYVEAFLKEQRKAELQGIEHTFT